LVILIAALVLTRALRPRHERPLDPMDHDDREGQLRP
jgi:hypothetical protein